MKMNIRCAILLLSTAFTLCVVGDVVAQGSAVRRSEAELKGSYSGKSAPKVKKRKSVQITTELGLGVGAHYNWFSVQPMGTKTMSLLRRFSICCARGVVWM